jgi:hypothetical protein
MMRILGTILGAVGLLFGAWAYSRARLPYNEEGRFFDPAEGVVYKTDAVVAFGFIAGVFLALAVVLFALTFIFNRSAKVMKSKSTLIDWRGDLADDCTAVWNGLMLRAEEMDRNCWWWAVTQEEGRGDEIGSSNSDDRDCQSGEVARMRAEECARAYLNVQHQ